MTPAPEELTVKLSSFDTVLNLLNAIQMSEKVSKLEEIYV